MPICYNISVMAIVQDAVLQKKNYHHLCTSTVEDVSYMPFIYIYVYMLWLTVSAPSVSTLMSYPPIHLTSCTVK